MGLSFLGGVCDERLERAFLNAPNSDIVSVRLSDGTVEWQREDVGRPLAAGLKHLIVSREAEKPGVALIDTADGELVAQISGEELGLVSPGAERFEICDAQIIETPTGAQVSVKVESRYAAGAPPPIEPASPKSSWHTLKFDAGAGSLAPSTPKTPQIDRPLVATPASVDPNIIAIADHIKGRFELALERTSSGEELILRALNDDGELQWLTRLGEIAPLAPGALRP